MSEKSKNIVLYSFLFIVILARIFFETAIFSKKYFFGYFVTIHHFCWYLFVFFYFSVCCRYILGMKRETAKYLTLLSPVIFTPLIHSYLTNQKLNLQYMEGNLKDVFFHIATFYKFHPKNSGFFIEMMILLIAFIVGSWFISKSTRRTLLNVIIGFYGSMLLAGLHLFGVYPRTKAYFKIHTSLKNHQLLSLIYFLLALTVFVIYSFPEIKKAFSKSKLGYISAVTLGICFSICLSLFVFEFIFGKHVKSADIFLTISPFIALSAGMFATIRKHTASFVAGSFFPIIFSIISIMIISGIILNLK